MLNAHTVTLGDREIKRIGLGTNRLTDTEANRSFLKEAVDAGLAFIDTAHIYTEGESEQTIGAALAPFSDDLVVATKAGYTRTELPELRSQVEQSFERLRTDRITLYYLHRVHPQIPIEESVGVLKEFVDAGRIDHVGLSEVSVEQITRAQAVTPIAADAERVQPRRAQVGPGDRPLRGRGNGLRPVLSPAR